MKRNKIIIPLAILLTFNLLWIYKNQPNNGLLFLYIVWQIAAFLGFFSSILIFKLLSRKIEPSFIMIVLFIILLVIHTLIGIDISSPISSNFETELWQSSPVLLMISWYISFLMLGCLAHVFMKRIS